MYFAISTLIMYFKKAKQAELATSEANYKLQQKKHQELEKQMNELRNEKVCYKSAPNISV